MKIKAVISVDIDARDYVDAADHQRAIETLIEGLRDAYPEAALTFKERRLSRRSPASAPTGGAPVARTGRLSAYVD